MKRPESLKRPELLKRLREIAFPAAFFAAWLMASGYTLHALRGLRALNAVEATIDLTVKH